MAASTSLEIRGNPEAISNHGAACSINTDPLFKCGVCGKQFLNASWLDKHMVMHVKSEQHSCDECGAVFSRKSSLQNHILSEHSNDGSNLVCCKICGQNVAIGEPLTKHLRAHTHSATRTAAQKHKNNLLKTQGVNQKSPKRRTHVLKWLKCNVCRKTFDRASSLSNHLRVHQKVKVPNQKRTISETSLNSQKTSSLPSVASKPAAKQPVKCKKFICSVCKKSWRNKRSLLNHMCTQNIKHPRPSTKQSVVIESFAESNLEGCSSVKNKVGNIGFKSNLQSQIQNKSGNLNLTRHKLQASTSTSKSSTKHKCHECLILCISDKGLQNHRFTHISKRSYDCKECGIQYRTKQRLQSHLPSHKSSLSHKCLMCTATYESKQALVRHLKMHGKRSMFTCVHCKFIFCSRTVLKTHIRVRHTRKLKFNCHICHSQFGKTGQLAQHLELHSEQQKLEIMNPTEGKALPPLVMGDDDGNNMKVGNQFVCQVCCKNFTCKKLFKEHMQKLHKKFYCIVCGSFVNRNCIMRTSGKLRVCRECHSIASMKIDKGTTGTPSPPCTSTKLSIAELVAETLALLVDEDFLKSLGVLNKPVDKQLETVVKACGAAGVKRRAENVDDGMVENVKRLITASIGREDGEMLFKFKSVEDILISMLESLNN